jgi:cytochrome c oxidase subunit 2
MKPDLVNAVQQIDQVFLMIFGLSFGLLAVITTVMIYFTIRYRRERHPEPVPITGHWLIETVWTVIPTVLVLIIFVYGWRSYLSLRNGPPNSLKVTVEARQYAWNFVYANGRTCEDLIVPAGQPVQLTLVSKDVLHGLFIPAFRLKRDVVPGMRSQAWFAPQKEGNFEIFCSLYCGTKHFDMRAELVIVSPALFADWYNGRIDTAKVIASAHNREFADAPPGIRVLKKYGCLRCHSLDGSDDVGPTFKGMYGHDVTVICDGQRRVITVDDDYTKRAIVDPKSELVAGYGPMMAPYELTPEEMAELLVYLKELGRP